MMLTRLILFVMLSLPGMASAQIHLLPNEELLYSFETNKGKNMTLAKDKQNKYIIYRYGSKNKIEFEYPAKTKDSWSAFTYSFYFRGGGIANAGLDLNYIHFSNAGFEYLIYDTYSAEGNATTVGIRVRDKKSKKETTITGRPETRKGTLIDFRDNGLLKIKDITFE